MTGWLRTAALVVAMAMVAGAGCGRAPRSGLQYEPDPWLADAAGRHRAADLRLDAGDAPGARAQLQAIVEPGPSGDPLTQAHRLALQDTYFRLARLALESKDARQAVAYADAGLAHGTAPHLFVANLLVARGAAREALDDPRAAAEDYHRALVMNETLLSEALAPR